MDKSQDFSKIVSFLVIWNCLAQQMSNADATSGVTDSSYFFYQRPEYPRDCQEVLQGCSNPETDSGVYLIKPDGYTEAFEVFCNNSVDTGGWTVVQRRIDGSLDFNRDWNEYKEGFGFLSSEFWLGNEKLSLMLNQKKYELRFDIVTSEGSSCHFIYEDFRISDGFSNYVIVSTGEYSGNTDSCIVTCSGNTGEGCGCTMEGGSEIMNGESSLNSDCSRNCSCIDNQLTCEDYACSPDATCREIGGVHQCQCNQGLIGNGQTCVAPGADCMDLFNAGVTTDGIYTIQPAGWPSPGFQVFCEMESNGGGWTVFQRRVDGTVDFYRNWTSYKEGFGGLNHEFWLGNDKLYTFTNQKNYQLRVDAVNSQGTSFYNLHDTFRINDESDKYRLTITSISGGNTGGGSALGGNNDNRFSTYDQDNDPSDTYHCAQEHRGAWWYWGDGYASSVCYRFGSSNRFCSASNLNGDYQRSGPQSIFFYQGNSVQNSCGLTRSEMKLRPF